MSKGMDKNKSTGEFILALKLFLGNNRWSAVIRREKKTGAFYSSELEDKLHTLDKFYVTGIVWIVGVLICLFTLKLGLTSTAVMIILAIFTVADVFLISPMIYLAVLPRPLSEHIRDSKNLDEEDRATFERQVEYDPHRENLMYKYRERGEGDKVGLDDFLGRKK